MRTVLAMDRDTALRTAERLIRQGRLEEAIAEYVYLVEAQPDDWSSVNALGDLCARAGDRDRALAQVVGRADRAFGDGLLSTAAALYRTALRVRPGDEHTLQRLADIAARQGLPAEARQPLQQGMAQRRGRGDEDDAAATEAATPAPMRDLLTREAAGEDPDLLLEFGRIAIDAGRQADALAAFTQLIAAAPEREADLIAVGVALAGRGALDAGYGCVEIVADAALLAADWQHASDILAAFTRAHAHEPALLKLVEIAAEAGLADVQREARTRLADLYLAAGRGADARDVLAPLVTADPANEEYGRRLTAALALAGEAGDADPALATPSPDASDAVVGPLDLFDTSEPDLSSFAPASRGDAYEWMPPLDRDALAAAFDLSEASPDEVDVLEVDLTDAVGGERDRAEAGSTGGVPDAPQLEAVFEQMRNHAAHEQQFAAAQAAYAPGVEALERGHLEAGAEALAAASSAPLLRFSAAARLGQAYLASGNLPAAVAWFERAASAPPPTPEQGFDVGYGLADALERTGDEARALTVLMALRADAGRFRDVDDRIARLTQRTIGGPPA